MDKITEIDGSLRSSINLGSKLTKNKLNFNGGVYLLSALSDASHYVGSAQNHYTRLASHIYHFNFNYSSGFAGTGLVLDLTNKYHWAIYNGGASNWQWHEIYSTFNYYLEFLQTYPFYQLSKGEYLVLAYISQFLPRVLEQSLLSSQSFKWNKQTVVNHKYCPWLSCYLSDYAFGVKPSAQLVIKDFYTGEILRSSLPRLTMAGDLLGIRTYPSMKWALKHQTPIYWSVVNRTVQICRAPKHLKQPLFPTPST